MRLGKIKRRDGKQTSSQKSYAGYAELVEFDAALLKYNTHLVKKMIRLSRYEPGKTVLDFGAGIGSLADLWVLYAGIKPECIEIDGACQRALRSKEYVVYPDLFCAPDKYNVIYSSNVLEHIEDDLGAILSFKQAMQESSIVLAYVPAIQFLYSDLDRKVGHYRRYSKRDLTAKFTVNGFEIISCHYVDCIGVIVSLLIKLFGWRGSLNIGSRRSVKFYDTYIFPMSSFLDWVGFKMIGGKNLFLVARIDRESLHK